MFIQVIQGAVDDRGELRSTIDRWASEIGPEATGWLGTTCGVTDDGTAIAMARFQSEEAARANSERPEQHQWWMEMSKLFAGEVTFHDCAEVIPFLKGGADDAGFVQVIQGRTDDMDRLREVNEQFAEYAHLRPELLGGVVALHGDGGFTQVAYFTSEQEARAGESQEPPEEIKAVLDEEMSLMKDISYFDLHEPWLYSPR
jgi:hypothetical protein